MTHNNKRLDTQKHSKNRLDTQLKLNKDEKMLSEYLEQIKNTVSLHSL